MNTRWRISVPMPKSESRDFSWSTACFWHSDSIGRLITDLAFHECRPTHRSLLRVDSRDLQFSLAMAGLGQKAELHQAHISVPFGSQSARSGPVSILRFNPFCLSIHLGSILLSVFPNRAANESTCGGVLPDGVYRDPARYRILPSPRKDTNFEQLPVA